MSIDAPVQGTLYHRPATAVRGDEILPLSELRTRFPDLYERHAGKYADRPEAMEARVDPLGCTWADVVFLSPVHPGPLFAVLSRSAVGCPLGMREPWTLDAARLDPSRTVIRLMRAGRNGHHADPPDSRDYLPFSTAALRAVSRIPLAAVERLESLRPGDPWLPWVDIPHILHRGPIPIAWFHRSPAT